MTTLDFQNDWQNSNRRAAPRRRRSSLSSGLLNLIALVGIAWVIGGDAFGELAARIPAPATSFETAWLDLR